MMTYQIPWLELALTFAPTLLAIGCYELAFVRPLRRRSRELAAFCKDLERATKETAGLTVRAANGERRMGGELSQLAERLGQLELRSDARPYAQAISLAEKGEEAERLVSCFGLTEGEASLVRLLHGDRQVPAAGD